MPIEIRELIIRTTVQDEPTSKSEVSPEKRVMSNEVLVQECVDRVMELLKEKLER